MIPGSANSLLLTSSGDDGFKIERSLRFNSADSANLTRTPSSAGNRTTWTWSAWIKRTKIGATQRVFAVNGAANNDNEWCSVFFHNDQLHIGGYTTIFKSTNGLFRDPSAWMHIVAVADLTNSTSADKFQLYSNGTRLETNAGSVPSTTGINAAREHYLGSEMTSGYCDMYLADVHFIDAQALAPTDFGEFDDNNVWQPKKYSGTYGTNGFYLDLADNSTVSALGTDTSGNSNNWTVNNLSVTAGAGNDSLVDTPTNYGDDTGAGGEVRGNYATFNPLTNYNRNGASGGGGAFKQGNLVVYGATTAETDISLTMKIPTSGKYYLEITYTAAPAGAGDPYIWVYPNGNLDAGGRITAHRPTNGQLVGLAFDRDTNNLYVYVNNVLTTTITTMDVSLEYNVGVYDYFRTNWTYTLNSGQLPFTYTAPSGYKALCTQNLNDPLVKDGSKYFDAKVFTGDGSAKTVTGYQFEPDMIWLKNRSISANHELVDAIRGVNSMLFPNDTQAENTSTNRFTSFNSDGFTIGTGSNSAPNGNSNVGWAWDAGSSTVTNNNGSISSQIRANPSAGFSIVSYNSGSTNGDYTLGHGLNAPPQFIIHKSRSSSNWWVYHADVIDDMKKYLQLNSYSGVATNSGNMWGASAPTSNVFGIRVGDLISQSQDAIAYCFAPVEGYSKMSSYVGSGNQQFVYCGFTPAWLMIKRYSDNTVGEWSIYDTSRSPLNEIQKKIWANNASAEEDHPNNSIDIVSNGFVLDPGNDAPNVQYTNNSGVGYLYVAFAENPFKTSRAR